MRVGDTGPASGGDRARRQVAVELGEPAARPGVAQAPAPARGRGRRRPAGGRGRRRRPARGPRARGAGARPPDTGNSVERQRRGRGSRRRESATSAAPTQRRRAIATAGGPPSARRSPRGTVTRTRAAWWSRRRGSGGGRRATARRRRPGRRPALGVAEQRIDGRRRRQQPVGCAEHDDEVDVEAGRAGQRADVDAVADLAVAGRGDLELGDERGPELGAGDRRPPSASRWPRRSSTRCVCSHAVRSAPVEAIERRRGRTSGRAGRATSPPTPRHGRTVAGSPSRAAQLGDERRATDSALARRRAARDGAASSMASAGGGWPSRPRGRCRRAGRCAPTGRSGPARPSASRAGHVAEQRHQPRAPQAAAVELEQLGQHAGHHPLGGHGAGAAVPRDAGRGRAGARPCGRTGGRSATARPCGRSGCRAGGVDDGRARRSAPRRRRRWSRRPRRCGDLGVRSRCRAALAGEPPRPDRERRRRPRRHRSAPPRARSRRGARARRRGRPSSGRKALGQVDDDMAEPVGQLGADPFRRPHQQVALVVPVEGRARGHGRGDARRLGGPLAASGERAPERSGTRQSQLAVQVAQGDDGRRVVGDRAVEPGDRGRGPA